MTKKQQIHGWYRQRLEGVAGLQLAEPAADVVHSHWMTHVMVDPSYRLDKLTLMARLRARGVDARPLFHPLSSLPAFTDVVDGADYAARNPTSYRAGSLGHQPAICVMPGGVRRRARVCHPAGHPQRDGRLTRSILQLMPTSISITAAALYRRLEIPPNLQRHMLRVAAVATLVWRHWRGDKLDGARVIRVLLLHDLGNIVKCDYQAMPEMLEEEQPNVAHWRQVQRRYLARFGPDAALATSTLAHACGLDGRERALLAGMDFWRTREASKGDDYEVMLAAYADHRVSPFGVVSQRARFAEAVARYQTTPDSPMSTPRAQRLIACGYHIEERLFEHCSLLPSAIDDAAIAPLLPGLREVDLRPANPANLANLANLASRRARGIVPAP